MHIWLRLGAAALAVYATPVSAQSIGEPSSTANQMQGQSINQNIGAMVALRNLNSVSDALSAQTKTPGQNGRADNAVDDGAAFAVAQGLRGNMAALQRTNDGKPSEKQVDVAALQARATEIERQLLLNRADEQMRNARAGNAPPASGTGSAPNTNPPSNPAAGGGGIGSNTSTQVALDTLRQVTDRQQQANDNAGSTRSGDAGARIDPNAGVDPSASQTNAAPTTKQPGGSIGQSISLSESMRSNLQNLSQTNAGNTAPTTKQPGDLTQQALLDSLPAVLRNAVLYGLLTPDEARAFMADVNDASTAKLPSQQQVTREGLAQTFLRTAAVATTATSIGQSVAAAAAAIQAAALVQSGLTQAANDFAAEERKTQAANNPWADFAYYSAGQVTPIAPTHALNGTAEGNYTGRVSGAFGNGDAVSGTLSVAINFAGGEMDGNIAFANGQGTIGLLGSATGTSISANVDLGSNNAFGGTVAGSLNGQMFGPRAEEIGGNWNLSVTGGARDGQSANGAFAGKQ